MVLRILDVNPLLHHHRKLRMPKKQFEGETFFRPGRYLDKAEFCTLLINHIQLLPFVLSNIPWYLDIPEYVQAFGFNSLFTVQNSRCKNIENSDACLNHKWCVWDKGGTILSGYTNKTHWQSRCLVGYNETNSHSHPFFLPIGHLPTSLFTSGFLVIWFMGFLCGIISLFVPLLSCILYYFRAKLPLETSSQIIAFERSHPFTKPFRYFSILTRKHLERDGIPSVTFNWWEFYSFDLNYVYSYRIELYRKEFNACRKKEDGSELPIPKFRLIMSIFSFCCMISFVMLEVSINIERLFREYIPSLFLTIVFLVPTFLSAFVIHMVKPKITELIFRKYWLEMLLLWLRLQILPYLSTSFAIMRCIYSISSDGTPVYVMDVAPNIQCHTPVWWLLTFTGISMVVRVTGSLPTLLLLAEADHARFIEPEPIYEIWFWVYAIFITFISITFPEQIYARLMFTILILLYDLMWLLREQPYKKVRVLNIKIAINLLLMWCSISSCICLYFYNLTKKKNLLFVLIWVIGCIVVIPLGIYLGKYIRYINIEHEKNKARFLMADAHHNILLAVKEKEMFLEIKKEKKHRAPRERKSLVEQLYPGRKDIGES